jgi:hypothetical protein
MLAACTGPAPKPIASNARATVADRQKAIEARMRKPTDTGPIQLGFLMIITIQGLCACLEGIVQGDS